MDVIRGIALALAAAMLLVAAPGASAHVKLRSFEPTGGKPLRSAPEIAVLTFSADVEDAFDEVIVRDPDGRQVDAQETVEGSTVTVDLPGRMRSGTWTVEYAVVGADGHPIRNEQSFSIGAASSHAAHGSRYPTQTIGSIAFAARVVFFLSLLLFVGGGVFALRAAPGFLPTAWGVLALHVVTGAIGILGSHAAIAGRLSLLEMLDPREWLEAAVSTGGRGYALAAIAVLAALRVGQRELAPARWRAREGRVPRVVLALVLVAAAAPTLSSHAIEGGSATLRVPLDMLHVLAGAIWIGGLVQLLALTIERRAGNPGIPAAVVRYSQLAFASVVTLVITGTIAAWVELDGNVGDLFGSAYGRLVLLKLALLLATIPLARANQVSNVPDLRRGGPATLARLRRFVAWEFAIVVWVVVATAALVSESPPGQDSAHGGMHAAAAAR